MRPGHVIVACVLALLTLGVIMVTSAGMNINASQPISLEGILFSRLTVYFVLALVAVAISYHLAPRGILARLAEAPLSGAAAGDGLGGWKLGPLWIGAVSLVFLMALVYVPGLGSIKNGAHRWLAVPLPGLRELSIQPSELAKWGLIFLMGWYCTRLGPKGLGRFFTGLLPALVAIGLVAGFMILEDLGTAVLLVTVAFTMLLAAGSKVWHFAMLAPAPVLGFVGAVVMHPYRLERMKSFMDPYTDPAGKGYHMIQSMIAVANGQVTGRGLGHGLQKFGYLPEDTTDFIYAIICEELGVPGAVLVAFLYVLLAWAGISIVRANRSPYLKLVGMGIVATVGFQALINLAVVTALGPTKGIALPLLSSGGTGWILTGACLGFLAGMDKGSEEPAGTEVREHAASAGNTAASNSAQASDSPLAVA